MEEEKSLVVALARGPRAVMRAVTTLVVFGPAVLAIAAIARAFHNGLGGLEIASLVVAYVLGTLGVTLGYHRFFAHRSFQTSRPMQALLIMFGSCALQGPLLFWVATHRRHHRFSDTSDDPHSPHFGGSFWRGLWHGHTGWMFASEVTNLARFAPDILRDRFVFAWQRRYWTWVAVSLAAPALITLAVSHNLRTALDCALWAGPVRIMLVHQASWAVGSISHLWGRRPFATDDRSANNTWVAIAAFGEGLQNNHHAFPTSARHGLSFGEPDLTGWVIDLFERLGLIWDVSRPTPEMLQSRRSSLPGARNAP